MKPFFFVGPIMDEESDDEYDEELEMNLNSFRNEAAKNPPIVVDYDNDNDEEGEFFLISSRNLFCCVPSLFPSNTHTGYLSAFLVD